MRVELSEEGVMVRLSGVPCAEECGHGSLRYPARQGRARERRCPYGSGGGVPQDSQGRPELAAKVFPRLGARPASKTQVHLALIHKHISKGGAQFLGGTQIAP